MIPQRVQRSRAKGWRLPPGTVCVDRSTCWGNPFKVDLSVGFRAVDAVDCFDQAIELGSPLLKFRKDELWKLRGKNLACFCPLDQPCHADILLILANKETTNDTIDTGNTPKDDEGLQGIPTVGAV